MEQERAHPFVSKRLGKFQVSLWKNKRRSKGGDDYDMEDEEITRACVQYSRFNSMTNSWINQSIWCGQDELENLIEVIKQLQESEMQEDEGGEVQCVIQKFMQ